ncbi:MAG: PQQ-binding-like beta-propeller repeat protein [Oligoflexia bacterium]|nr:PQQ-binding-like beta-propeller repeat protein [Oligoflexia bacterium]
MRLIFCLCLGVTAGCSDYSLSSGKDANTTDDTGPGPSSDAGTTAEDCGSPDLSAGAVAIDETCKAPVEVGSWTPVIEWRSTAPGSAYTTPVVGQLTDDNGDGIIDGSDTPDIVVANTSGTVTALSGGDGAVLWTFSGMGSEPSTVAIGDLTGDGRPEVVTSGSPGFVALSGDTGTEIWRYTVSGYAQVCGGVGIYDLDGDGIAEVVQGNLIIDGRTGRLRGAGAHGKGTGHSSGAAAFGVAADINQDGALEVVVGNALYDADGNTIWYNGETDGFVAVANFDDDPYGEIVVTTYPGMVRLQDDDGTVLWSGYYTGSTVGPPTVADFDGDGKPEIGVAGNGVYVVIEDNGVTKWSRPISDYSSGFTGSAVFDFEGDGKAEVVFADENDVWVFDGSTGDVKMQETSHSSATCSEYPAIADVDGDGHAEIIYSSSEYSGPEEGVTVIGDRENSWMPAAETWNQHAYSITNVANSADLMPTSTETNWLTYNSFRSGDLAAATGGALGDVVPLELDVCTTDCDSGHLYVSAQVGNTGLSQVPAGIATSLYSKHGASWELLDTVWTDSAIASGRTSAGFEWDLDPADVPEGLKIVVDDEGGVQHLTECNEDNNEWVISTICP